MVHTESERFKNSKLRLFSRLKLKNILPGEWDSIHIGEGIEFSSSKPYEAGDDLRRLDLHTLAQTGEEEITLQAVGRQRKIYLWVDLSGSMQRSPEMLFAHKPDIRDIAVGILAFSALRAYSAIGLCAFDHEIRQFFPARSGERYCEEIVGGFLDHADGKDKRTADIPGALASLEKRVAALNLVFFISDFQNPLFEGAFASLLRPVAKQFDFVPVVIRDPLEHRVTLKHSVAIELRDSETGSRAEIRLTPKKLAKIQEASARHLAHLERNFRGAGLEHVVLDSPSVRDCLHRFASFFEARRRAKG